MTEAEEGFADNGRPIHEHTVQRATGVAGEPAWYCQVCEAYTVAGQVIRPRPGSVPAKRDAS